MALNRSYTNPFGMEDRTADILRIPTNLYTIGALGLFQEQGVANTVVQFEEQNIDGSLIVDSIRGERANVVKDRSRKVHTFAIPHFTLDTYISPQDVIGKRAYGNNDEQETMNAVRLRKMEDIARDWDWTHEVARAKVITTGDVYAPNGTVVQNWYTEFGATQQTKDFVLGTGTTEVLIKQEEVITLVTDGLQNGAQVNGVIALASTKFFNALVTHPTVKAAYANWTNQYDPTRLRAGGVAISRTNRFFSWGGIDYYEIKDSYKGSPLIPVGDCYFLPAGADIFKTFYAPTNRFDALGNVGEKMYMYEYTNPRNDKIEIETESNFAHMVTAPLAIVRGFTA